MFNKFRRLFNFSWNEELLHSFSTTEYTESTERAAFLCVLCALCGFSNQKIIKSQISVVTCKMTFFSEILFCDCLGMKCKT